MRRLLVSLYSVALATGCHAAAVARDVPEVYDERAVRVGTLANFPVRALVAGADSSRRMDVAVMVWMLRSNNRVVLVDAGFYRDKFIARWSPADYLRPSEAVRAAGVEPGDVTDIIVSHVHWDHLDGVDLFPNATIWLQRAEYEHHIGLDGAVLDRAVDADDATMLARLRSTGRVRLIDGDAREVLPGITVYIGGKHTFESQYAGVRTRSGTAVIASDNAYLYENLENRRPIAQTLDSLSNLAAQARMLTIASSPRLVVPGHDPLVFQRFPLVRQGVVRID